MGMLNEHKLTYADWLNNNQQLLNEGLSTTDLEALYEEYLSNFDSPATD